jgi:glutaredoxin
MNIILYSTHCPKCYILEKKLKEKNIAYTEVNDVDVMTKKGFATVPMLEVDGTVMDFKEANDWVNNN